MTSAKSLTSVAVGLLVLITAPAVAAAQPTSQPPLRVPRDFETIQAAVDAAAPGDTIAVDAGTRTEEVVVEKDLDIRGAGVDRTVIMSPSTLTPYGVHLTDGRDLTAIVRVGRGANVRLSHLTVSGPIPCGIEVTGVHAFQGATLQLSDARVTGIQADPRSCAPDDAAGRAVVFGTPPHIVVDGQRGTAAFGRITRVVVDHYQHAGVTVTGPRAGDISRVTVTDNTIRGGWDIPSFQAGVWIDDGAAVEVARNAITGNRCGGPGCGGDPITEGQGIGVFVLGVRGSTRIDHNTVTGNDVGVNQLFSPNCCDIRENQFTDNRYFGIVLQDGDATTLGNRITGGQTGIVVVADALDTTGVLRGDQITGTTSAPVREIECCGYTATAQVQHR